MIKNTALIKSGVFFLFNYMLYQNYENVLKQITSVESKKKRENLGVYLVVFC